MVIVLQILFVLLALVVLLLLMFRPRRAPMPDLPENFQELLQDYVLFYANLDEAEQKRFDEKFRRFLSSVRISGANAEVEDLDRVLIGAAAVIPVYFIPDWEYINLREVLLYPGLFNHDYEQQGRQRLSPAWWAQAHSTT